MLFRCLAVFAAIFLSSIFSFAQYKPFKQQPFHKKWEDGKLTWDDFKGKPMKVTSLNSELIYYFLYQPERIKKADTIFLKIRAISYIDRNQSWVHDTAKTETQLKSNQAIFNVIELHERLLENRLLTLENAKEIPQVYQEEFRNLRELYSRIELETKGGKDTTKLNSWLAKTYHQIDSVKTNIPAFSLRNFGFGYYLGYSQANVNGKLADGFTNFSGLGFGVNCIYRDWALFMNYDMGSGKTLAEYNEKYFWPSNLRVTMGQFNPALGYSLLNSRHWRVVPSIGLAFVHVSPTGGDDKTYEGQKIMDNAITYGLQFDWKFRNFVNLARPGKQVLLDYGLRTRFNYCPVEFSRNLNGSTYNISLATYFQTRNVRLKK